MYTLILDNKKWSLFTTQCIEYVLEFYNVDWQEANLAVETLKANNHRKLVFGGCGTFQYTE